MMKFIINRKYIFKIALFVLAILSVTNISHASNDINFVVISGQIINMEYGNPVEGHEVIIESDSTQGGLNGYYNTLLTNNEGYYYDTVYTNETKGSFVVSTVDYFGKAIDTTVHFRFMERANQVLIANFLIYMPYQPVKLQARFKYVQKQDDNRMKYSFVDQTNAENIIGWHWDFGDGTISNSQNAVHTYHIFGLYKISLTVTAVVNNELKTSIISKQLYISDQDYYHLGGHVFSEYFPIDMGYAYLYMIDSHERYIAIDTIAFDTLGYYFFYQIPSGKYMVKAEPMYKSQYYGTLLPTYYGDKIFWEESVTINLTSTSWEYNINLGYAEGVSGGEGSISGNIIYDNLPRFLDNLSAEGVNIYLFDESDKLLTCHYSDNLGDFSFDQVELNSYKLYPEITGIEAEKVVVELTLEDPIVDNIEIIIFSNSVSYVVPNDEPNTGDIVGLPYPNPTQKAITIPLNLPSVKNVSYEIYNMFGQMILSSKVDVLDNYIGFNISVTGLNNGSYILRAKVNGDNYDRVFIVAR